MFKSLFGLLKFFEFLTSVIVKKLSHSQEHHKIPDAMMKEQTDSSSNESPNTNIRILDQERNQDLNQTIHKTIDWAERRIRIFEISAMQKNNRQEIDHMVKNGMAILAEYEEWLDNESDEEQSVLSLNRKLCQDYMSE